MDVADFSAELVRVQALMRRFPAPWCVGGGWALDLFVGRALRRHADVDLVLFRRDQAHLREHFLTWTFQKVVDKQLVDWPAGECLLPPVHEIHARSADDPPQALEFLLNEHDEEHWRFRRDLRVVRSLDRLILRAETGLPILCPEVVLLYKAKAPRAADDADFEAVRESLGAERQSWLRGALDVCHAGHSWIARLQAEPR